MKGFSEENFELKVYLKYIIDKSKDDKPKKCLYDYIEEENEQKLVEFLERYEFTYINLSRLATNDQELIPLMTEFISLYEHVDDIVFALKQKKNPKVIILNKQEGNEKNE